MSENIKAENRMGTMPVNKLLVSMSLPMIISMLVQAMYNIIDSIFVAKISEAALTAVSIAFPIQALMIAIAAGTGVGINALLSRALGEKKTDLAKKAAVNGIFLGILSFVVFALFGCFGVKAFFSSQTSNPEIVKYGTEYLSICCIFSFGIFLEITYERILQSTGQTFYNMITQGCGAIINIILDPILIFGLLGMPKMGIRGAAIATVTGQIIAMILAIYFNLKKNSEVSVSMIGFKPDFSVIKIIYEVGIPSMVMQSIVSVMTLGLNKILITFSETAVSVLGIYFKLQSFIFMPVFGLNNGMIPIVAYNYGAARKERIIGTIKLSIYIAVGIMLIGVAVFQLMPVQLLNLFNASEHMLTIGVPALRIISISFILAGYNIIISSMFQALGNAIYSLIISVSRQLLCILPFAYFFSRLWGVNAVWIAFPVAEILSLTLCTLMFKHVYTTKISTLGKPLNGGL